MKHKFLPLYLILCLILGLSSTAKANYNNFNGPIYFDNQLSQWDASRIQFIIGSTDYRIIKNTTDCTNDIYMTTAFSWDDYRGYYFMEYSMYEQDLAMDFLLPYMQINRFGDSNTSLYHTTDVIQLNDPTYNSRHLCVTPTTNPTGLFVSIEFRAVPLKNLEMANNSTTIYGGTGTALDPYLIKKGDSFSFTASADYIDATSANEVKYTATINDGTTPTELNTTESSTGATPTPHDFSYATTELASYTVTFKALNSTTLSTTSIGYNNVYADSRYTDCNTTLYYKVIDQPTIVSTAISNLTENSATLTSTVEENDAAISEYGFYYSVNKSNLSTADLSRLTYDGNGYNSENGIYKIFGQNSNLTSLAGGTTYYFVPYAINTAGTTQGTIQEFTTTAALQLTNSTTAPIAGTYTSVSYTIEYSDLSHYLFVSMPFDVSNILIKQNGETEFSSITTANTQLLSYNTAKRASGIKDGTEWDRITTNTMTARTGYMIGFDNALSTPIQIKFIKHTSTDIDYVDVTKNLDELSSTTDDGDSNWHLIGSSMWDDAKVTGPSTMAVRKSDNSGYNYILNIDGTSGLNIEPYTSFFVQYSGDVTSTLTTTTPDEVRAQSPQESSQNGQEYYIFNISGTSADNTARAAVCLDPNGSNDYVAGRDFPNLNGAGTCALFTTLNAKDYFLNNVPDTTTTLSLNATLTADETYTISMEDRSNSAVNIWLVDHVLNTTTDLKVNNYSFAGTTGAVQGRFTVQIAKTQQIPTGNNNQSDSELEVYAAQGSITIQGLNPEAKVYLYNAVGQLMAQPQVKESSLLISEMPAGFYLIKISDFEGNHTYKLQL